MILVTGLLVALGQATGAADVADKPVVQIQRSVVGFSEQGDLLGHTGYVIVDVVVHPDGAKETPAVAISSRSSQLDVEALQLIKDATLRPPLTSTQYRIRVEFRPNDIVDMKCAEFSRQEAWYRSAWPEAAVTDIPVYTMSVGAMGLLARDRSGRSGGLEAMLRPAREMEAVWPRVVADCARQPDAVYLRVLAAYFR